jgi:hypothetical protein
MTTIQDQYTAFTQQSQEATVAIVDAWTESVQSLFTRVPATVNQAAAEEIVDQTFDFFQKVVDAQRGVAKQLVSASANAAEEAVQRATSAANEAEANVRAAAAKVTAAK